MSIKTDIDHKDILSKYRCMEKIMFVTYRHVRRSILDLKIKKLKLIK